MLGQSIKSKLQNINSYLVVFLGFSIALAAPLASITTFLILSIWLVSNNWQQTWHQLTTNQFILAIIIYISLYIVGLLWSTDLEGGLHILGKQWKYFLLLPILITTIKKNHLLYYLVSFTLGVLLSAILSELMLLDILDYRNPKLNAPTAFTGYIAHSPMLAFASYMSLIYILVYPKNYTKCILALICFSILSINLFSLAGRAGHIVFFCMLGLFCYQALGRGKIIITIAAWLGVCLLFIGMLNFNDSFKQRIQLAGHEASNYTTMQDTSVGLRIRFALNSLKIIKEHPLVGVGTGDFYQHHKQIEPNLREDYQRNPHNMYALIGAQFGIVGLLTLLWLFYCQIKISRHNTGIIKYIGTGLPIFYMLICLSETYLNLHYTSIMFVYLSAILYKNYDLPPRLKEAKHAR